MRVRWKESARVAALVNAKPNQCFTNCYQVRRKLEDYKRSPIVRGTVVVNTGDEICEEPHVWLEKNGWIIDPTIVLVCTKDDVLSYKPLRKFEKLPKVARIHVGLMPLGDFYED